MSVTEEEWDPVKERVKGRGKDAKDKNLIIENIRSRITDILVKSRLTNTPLSRESFESMLNQPVESNSFIDFADNRLATLKSALQYETYRHHKTALKKLQNYNAKLLFSDITPEWLRVYAAHLEKSITITPEQSRKTFA